MRQQRTSSFDPASITHVNRDGLLVLSGYGLRIFVERGHLCYEDGIGGNRRQGRIHRATGGLKRLIVLGHTGFVTLEALRWLRDVGAVFVQIDVDGVVIADNGPWGRNDARLRRAQALSTTNGLGLNVAKELIGRKLAGQARVLGPFDSEAKAALDNIVDSLEVVTDRTQLNSVESIGASLYWRAWQNISISFGKNSHLVPDHWRNFGSRTSVLTGSPRVATNPANAVLNFLYALLEFETTVALRTVGLDPGLGVLHADQEARASLSCDVMEAARPDVDAFLFDLLRNRTFSPKDFLELRDGRCRMSSVLATSLAQTAPAWRRAVAPLAEWTAKVFASSPIGRPLKAPTPLTEEHRRRGRASIHGEARAPVRKGSPTLPTACRVCGTVLENPSRVMCDECFASYEASRREEFAVAGKRHLATARKRAQTLGGEVKQKQSSALSTRRRALEAWRAENEPGDPEYYKREVFPRLASISVTVISKATGLSRPYCLQIRRGDVVPHARHWKNLLEILKP